MKKNKEIYQKKLVTPVGAIRMLLLIPFLGTLVAHALNLKWSVFSFSFKYNILVFNEFYIITFFFVFIFIIIYSYRMQFLEEKIVIKGVLTNREIKKGEILSYQYTYIRYDYLCTLKLKEGGFSFPLKGMKQNKLSKTLDQYLQFQL